MTSYLVSLVMGLAVGVAYGASSRSAPRPRR